MNHQEIVGLVIPSMADMIELQHRNNINTAGSNYHTLGLDWNTAILCEAGELLESTSYKWWKKVVPDTENVKTEVVDLWHFILSRAICELMETTNDFDITTQIMTRSGGKFFLELAHNPTQGYNEMGVINLTKEVLSAALDHKSFEHMCMYFSKLIHASGMDYREFVDRYIVKNALNTLRKNHGYKDGTYKKSWTRSDGTSAEDNVVALEVVSTLSEVSFKSVYEALEKVYAS